MQKLAIKAKCIAGPEQRIEHIKSALARGLEEFGMSPAHGSEVAVVGSGPSVKHQIKRIRKMMARGVMILAVKGAHDFLIENKIVPHAALAVDPQPHIVKCFRKKLPDNGQRRPVYLIASQCCPEVFDYFPDQRVILWHLLATSTHKLLDGHFQIGGGSTSGSRGIVLAWCMGFRKIHLFGFDSCLEGKGTSKLRKVTGDRYGGEKEQILELVCEGRRFWSDPAMSAQANEIQDVLHMLEGAQIKAWGKGLIQTIIESNSKKGMEGYYVTSDKFGKHAIPKPRKATTDLTEQVLQAAMSGVFRGSNYGDRAGPAVVTESG